MDKIIDYTMDRNSPKIAVIGAGIVGSTVAKVLQEEVKGLDVTVIADRFNEDTVSTVAAGVFRPGTSFRGPTPQITKKWVNDSWHYWNGMLSSADAVEAGLLSLSGYIFSKNNEHITRNHLIEDLVPVYRSLDENEMRICGEGWKYGKFFSTLKIDCNRHLPWLNKMLIRNGIKILRGKVDSFASLHREYDLVFDCTGLGAKILCNDHDLVSVRGQIIKVKAPWVKTVFYGDLDAYIIPGHDGVVTLGGTRQYDSYNTEVCKYDAQAIMDRCCELLPSLRGAKVVAHKVGLRPHRIPVRVEPELIDGLKVVHCYGHGGYGVTCAPGTAMHAVRIGMDLLKTITRNKL